MLPTSPAGMVSGTFIWWQVCLQDHCDPAAISTVVLYLHSEFGLISVTGQQTVRNSGNWEEVTVAVDDVNDIKMECHLGGVCDKQTSGKTKNQTKNNNRKTSQ